MKVVVGWRSAKSIESLRNLLKVSELNNSVKEWAYQESLRGKYKLLRCGDGGSLEKKWESFRDIGKDCTNDVLYVA